MPTLTKLYPISANRQVPVKWYSFRKMELHEFIKSVSGSPSYENFQIGGKKDGIDGIARTISWSDATRLIFMAIHQKCCIKNQIIDFTDLSKVIMYAISWAMPGCWAALEAISI